VAGLLIGHELNQTAGLGAEAGGFELSIREASKPIVEEVELDPLLIQSPRTRSQQDRYIGGMVRKMLSFERKFDVQM